jgi:hypothetical protein
MSRKQFDCVQMKRQAQQGLRRALAGKTPEAQAAEVGRRAGRNPIWQALLREKAHRTRGRKLAR